MSVPSYDVIIMGGGPAGATLGATLVQGGGLKVAIVESEHFPREHIGESLSSLVVPCLQQSGALERVLSSDCYVKKYGGFYAWDAGEPALSLFRHDLWESDGCMRWSFHVNRAEFDQLLLEHARDSGVSVREGVAVDSVKRDGNFTHVTLSNGETLSCRVFVDASGRQNKVKLSRRRFLSNYKNMAIWGHFTGGKPAQELSRDWNLFERLGVSPIACFAFRDGWVWYIPVRMSVGDRRVTTHSVGIVTDPRVLRRPGGKLTEMEVFVRTLKDIPLLQELIPTIEPVYPTLLTAANYSMISAQMCSYEEGWVLLGDAAYFVDPLFSSGVNFALLHALMASHIIRARLTSPANDAARLLWADFNQRLTDIARTFALAIDQWYEGIAEEYSDSLYWRTRGDHSTFEFRRETLRALVNGDFGSDLMRIIGGDGASPSSLLWGPIPDAYRRLGELSEDPARRIRLAEAVNLVQGLTLEQIPAVYSKLGKPSSIAHGPYWSDPLRFGTDVSPVCAPPVRCARFVQSCAAGEKQHVPMIDESSARELHQLLSGEPRAYAELEASLGPEQRWALQAMQVTGMLATSSATPTA